MRYARQSKSRQGMQHLRNISDPYPGQEVKSWDDRGGKGKTGSMLERSWLLCSLSTSRGHRHRQNQTGTDR